LVLATTPSNQEDTMTTYTETETRSTSWPMFAAIGTGISLVLTALGTLADLSGNDTTNGSLAEYLAVAGITVVAAAIVFGLVVRTTQPENAGLRAIVLAVAGLLSLVVFWTGLPAVLAAGSVSCAMAARGAAAKTAIAVSAVTVALAVVAAIAG
jgi:hypothetical protein